MLFLVPNVANKCTRDLKRSLELQRQCLGSIIKCKESDLAWADKNRYFILFSEAFGYLSAKPFQTDAFFFWSYCLSEVHNFIVEIEVLPGLVGNVISAHILPVSDHKEVFEVHLALVQPHVVRNAFGDDTLPGSFMFLLIVEHLQLSNWQADSVAPILSNFVGSTLSVLLYGQINKSEVIVDVFNSYIGVPLDQDEITVEVCRSIFSKDDCQVLRNSVCVCGLHGKPLLDLAGVAFDRLSKLFAVVS